YAQGLGELGGDRAKKLLLDLLSAKPDHRAVSYILKAMKQSKVEGLNAILLEHLKAQDVVVRATSATLLADLQDDSDGVITALAEAFKAARADKLNDA